MFVQSVQTPLEENPTRRRFYLAFIYGLWGLIGAGLATPALVYLFFPPKAKKEDEWVDAADVNKLQPNQPVEVVFRRNRTDGWRVNNEKNTAWVVKRPDNSVVAFGPQCTHLGCAYHWDETNKNFLCPCHTSVFSIDGKVVSGPAPRPLDRYTAKVENNRLMLGPLKESTERS